MHARAREYPVIEDLSLTEWTHRAAAGEPGALDRLFTQLYPELKRIAHARLFVGAAPGLISTTELVHESFMRFTRARHLALADRKHFFTYAATVMRHVIVDLARSTWPRGVAAARRTWRWTSSRRPSCRWPTAPRPTKR